MQRTTTGLYKVEGRFGVSESALTRNFNYGIFTSSVKVTWLYLLWKLFKVINRSHQ